MKILLILLYMISFLSSSTFVKKINIVNNNEKKLMWQDNNEVTQYQETFITAKVYCELLILNSYIDWRVPTIKELQSIVDVSKQNSIKKEFKYLKKRVYTTKTSDILKKNYIWVVDFKSGKTRKIKKINKLFVRCVRDNR